MADGKAQIILGATDQTRPAFESAKRNLASLQAEARRAAAQQQQLAFQLNDFFVQVASGGSPLTALIQQGSQLSGTFGGVGKAFGAVMRLLTPARLLFGGVAGAIGAVALAANKAANDSRELRDALTLSGNFAGQTGSQFEAMQRQIVDASNTLTGEAVRMAGQAAMATGAIGPETFGAATEAVARYAEATGQTAAEAAKYFAQMGRDVAKWAAEHNRAANFITAAEYAQIRALQEAGREVDAQAIVYDALNRQLRKLEDNLGPLDRLLAEGARKWDAFWKAAGKGVGVADTVADELADVERRIREAQQAANAAPGVRAADLNAFTGRPTLGGAGSLAKLEAERAALLRRQFREGENAYADSDRAATHQAGIAARERLDAMLEQTRGAGALSDALKKLQQDFKAAAAAGVPYTEAQQKLLTEATRKKFAGPADKSGEQLLRKQLDGRIEAIQQGLERERDAFQNSNAQLASAYADGKVSIDQFYDGKQRAQLEYLAAQHEAFNKEIAELEAHKKRAKTPAEKEEVDNRIARALAEQAKAHREAGQAATAAEAERVRATDSFKRSLDELDAQMAELSGNRYGAELLRNASRLREAQRMLAAGGGDPKRVEQLKGLLDRQAEANRLQEQFSLITEQQSAAEEAYLLTSRARGAGLLEQERGLQAIRERSIGQLETLHQQAQALAKASAGDPRAQLWAEQLSAALERARTQMDPTLERVQAATETFADGIADAVGGVLVDFGSLDDAFASLGRMLHQLVVQTLVLDPLRKQMQGWAQSLAPSFASFVKTGGQGGATATVGGAVANAAMGAATQGAANASVAALGVAASAAQVALGTMAGTVPAVDLALATMAEAALAATAALTAMTSAAASKGGTEAAGGLMALFAHSGGVVGQGGHFRSLPGAIFADAPRYHGGGIAGLAPDEVPAVLRRGEEVLRQGDPRHRDHGGGMPSKQINLSVNVSAAPGMSRQSALQQGAAAGRAARAALARND